MATPEISPSGIEHQGRSARKRQTILEEATNLFLRNGYLGTSMDDVAAAAHVSKQTVYKHFADKEHLFIEIVTNTVEEISDPVHQEVLHLADSGDIEADLRDLAHRLLKGVMQPRLLQLRQKASDRRSKPLSGARTYLLRGTQSWTNHDCSRHSI